MSSTARDHAPQGYVPLTADERDRALALGLLTAEDLAMFDKADATSDEIAAEIAEYEAWLGLPGNEKSRGRYRAECARLAAMPPGKFDAEVNRTLVMDAAGRCLAALRWRQAHRAHPLTWPLLLLIARATVADTLPEPHRSGDGRPLDDLSPPPPALLARATLTAAPPARVPSRAGTAG